MYNRHPKKHTSRYPNPAPHKSQKQIELQQIEERARNKDIIEACCALFTKYKQDPNIKLQAPTKEFLNIFNEFYSNPNNRDMYNRIKPEIVNDEKFQASYQAMIRNIIKVMNVCDSNTNPAEAHLNESEIWFVVVEKRPELLRRCDNLSEEFQSTLYYGRAPMYIRYLSHPMPSIVRDFCNMYPASICYIPPECLSAEQILQGILRGHLPSQNFSKDIFLNAFRTNGIKGLRKEHIAEFIKQYQSTLTEEDFLSILRVIKKDKSVNRTDDIQDNEKICDTILDCMKQKKEKPGNVLTNAIIVLCPHMIQKFDPSNVKLQSLAIRAAARKGDDYINRVYNLFVRPPIPETTPEMSQEEKDKIIQAGKDRARIHDLYQIIKLQYAYPIYELRDQYRSIEAPSRVVTEMYMRYVLDNYYHNYYNTFLSNLYLFEDPDLSPHLRERAQRFVLISGYKDNPKELSRAYQFASDIPTDSTGSRNGALFKKNQELYEFLQQASADYQDLQNAGFSPEKITPDVLQHIEQTIAQGKKYMLKEDDLFPMKSVLLMLARKNRERGDNS